MSSAQSNAINLLFCPCFAYICRQKMFISSSDGKVIKNNYKRQIGVILSLIKQQLK